MKFSDPIVTAILAFYTNLASALPTSGSPQSSSTLLPSSINCDLSSLNLSPPDFYDLKKAANRLAEKGGTCSTPAGSGNCVRVACDNTTGIWMCNTDGNDGSYSASCNSVAALVSRGEGSNDPTKDIFSTCQKTHGLSSSLVPGQAFSPDGTWNIITGWANCNVSPSNPPQDQ